MAQQDEDKKVKNEGKARGGSMSSGNFKNDPERARAAGRKGGSVSPGNFKNNPERASAAGKIGGAKSKRVSKKAKPADKKDDKK
jgi:general stress protein YciG